MRTHRLRWPAANVAVALSAAAVYQHVTAGTPLPGGTSRLAVYQVWVGNERYTEGSRSYLSVSAAVGGSHTFGYDVMNPGVPVFSRPAAPGRYTITTWQRPCDGYCGNLDGVADRCRRTVSLPPRRSSEFVIMLSPGHGCRIVRRQRPTA